VDKTISTDFGGNGIFSTFTLVGLGKLNKLLFIFKRYLNLKEMLTSASTNCFCCDKVLIAFN
ncbi:MAG: hypothetical protein ACE5HX_18210, partial [bacterium]